MNILNKTGGKKMEVNHRLSVWSLHRVIRKHTALVPLIIIAFLNLQSLSQVNSNWKWLHPKPQGNALWQCKYWDANTVYAVGSYGTFIKTTDGGNTWFVTKGAARQVINQGNGGPHTPHSYDFHFLTLIRITLAPMDDEDN
jgi:hypothetical protein